MNVASAVFTVVVVGLGSFVLGCCAAAGWVQDIFRRMRDGGEHDSEEDEAVQAGISKREADPYAPVLRDVDADPGERA